MIKNNEFNQQAFGRMNYNLITDVGPYYRELIARKKMILHYIDEIVNERDAVDSKKLYAVENMAAVFLNDVMEVEDGILLYIQDILKYKESMLKNAKEPFLSEDNLNVDVSDSGIISPSFINQKVVIEFRNKDKVKLVDEFRFKYKFVIQNALVDRNMAKVVHLTSEDSVSMMKTDLEMYNNIQKRNREAVEYVEKQKQKMSDMFSMLKEYITKIDLDYSNYKI